jgi:hypothetical protein
MDSKEKSTSTTSHSAQSAGSATVNFVDLPEPIRNKIYTSVLVVLHPLYLFQEPGTRVETFAPDRPKQWLALIYTNRQISREASAALYGVNHFHLIDDTQQQVYLLRSFLDCIGSRNAASLLHICINFPVMESVDDQPGKSKLRDDSLQCFKLLHDKCTNLSTLETLVHHKNSGVFRKTDEFLREALPPIDAQFKTIPSLKRIIVQVVVHDGVPTTSAKDFMQELGWVVRS